MSIAIDPEQLQYFKKYHRIEFEHLISDESILQIQDTFKKKFDLEKASDPIQSPLRLKEGFDLWREFPQLKKIICSVKLAKTAGQLMGLEKLRYGFSQFLSAQCFCNEFAFLYRKSCVKELLCGLCLCLEPSKEPENPFFPTKRGHGIFFEMDPDFYLRFPKSEGQYLFIFYAKSNAYYSYQAHHPLNISFRELGYEHGDRLKEDLNPSYSWMPL